VGALIVCSPILIAEPLLVILAVCLLAPLHFVVSRMSKAFRADDEDGKARGGSARRVGRTGSVSGETRASPCPLEGTRRAASVYALVGATTFLFGLIVNRLQ
jgi:hypothetical protein